MKRLPYLLCFALGACTEEMKNPLPVDDGGIVLTTAVGFPVDDPVTTTPAVLWKEWVTDELPDRSEEKGIALRR